MDPATAIQLVSSIGEICRAIYVYGTGVKEAKSEIIQLRGELFGLKAAVEHIVWSINGQFARLSLGGDTTIGEHDVSLDSQITLVDETEDVRAESNANASNASSYRNLRRAPLLNPLLETDECVKALEDAQKLLDALFSTLKAPSTTRASRIFQQASWPLRRGETLRYARHLESIKSYLVHATTSDNLHLSKEMYAQIRGLREHLEARHLATEEQTLREATQTWLTACKPSTVLELALSERQEGSGGWFTTGVFHPWQYSDVPVLWLRGKPGSGKTTLMSTCVQNVEQSGSNTQFAYFYCSVNDPASQELINILGSFVLQLCNQRPAYWHLPEKQYQHAVSLSKNSPKRPEISELETILQSILSDIPQTFLFLDAPNESEEAESIVRSLMNIASVDKKHRVMISSTEDMLSTIIKHGLSSPRIVDMEYAGGVHDDIGEYIAAHLENSKTLKSLPKSTKQELRQVLLQKADGSFRWIKCQIDYLTRMRSLRDIRLAIQQVPPTLNDTYIAVLMTISPADQQLMRRMLLWTTFALRNLTLMEIAEAMVFENTGTDDFTEARLLAPHELLKSAGSLIRYDPDTNRLALAHSSVRAFLTSDTLKRSIANFYYLDPKTCLVDMTVDCIDYLCLPVFRPGFSNNVHTLSARRRDWPLAKYASKYWMRHTSIACEICGSTDAGPPPIQRSLDAFFATAELPTGGCFSSWYELFYPQGNSTVWLTKPLYFAARQGLIPIARTILASEDSRKQLERPGGRSYSTPLHVAAFYGHAGMVKYLLELGADPNGSNALGETGLQWAHVYRDQEIMELLLAAGADPAQLDKAPNGTLNHIAQNELDEMCLADTYHEMEKWQKKHDGKSKPVKERSRSPRADAEIVSGNDSPLPT